MLDILNLNDFLQFDFLIYAALGITLLSIVAGLLSPLIVAKKYSFMGSALSHSTLLGLAISMIFSGQEESIKIFIITLLVTMLVTSFLAIGSFRQKIPSDSLIGIFFSTTMGLGILIHSSFAKGKGDLVSFLFGNILLLNKQDLVLLILLFIIVVPAILIPLKKWIYTCIDEEGALVSGINIAFYHYLFFFLITLAIVTSIKLSGTVLINTILLVPGVFAVRVARGIKQTFIYSLLFSIFTSMIGLIMANKFGLQIGATLSVIQFIFLAITYLPFFKHN